ncbi:hypothetical protein KA093_01340 [Candidatus Saccharibacteria bacterium]|nr:hypothetical protein [Candidatus Saccharibacteria bacterium]
MKTDPMNLDKIASMLITMQQNMATKQDVDDIKVSLDTMRNILDTHTGLLDTDELERLALQKQVERHQAWIDTVSPKLSASAL